MTKINKNDDVLLIIYNEYKPYTIENTSNSYNITKKTENNNFFCEGQLKHKTNNMPDDGLLTDTKL